MQAVCGKGEHIPGWDHEAASSCAAIFAAVGFSWASLDANAKLAAIAAYRAQAEKIGE